MRMPAAAAWACTARTPRPCRPLLQPLRRACPPHFLDPRAAARCPPRRFDAHQRVALSAQQQPGAGPGRGFDLRDRDDDPLPVAAACDLHDHVDCSPERLSRSLRARAAERHSRYLIEKSCRVRGADRVRVSCRASLAEPTRSLRLQDEPAARVGPAPSPAQVADLDEPRPQDGGQIRVSFAPRTELEAARRLRARAYDRVLRVSRTIADLHGAERVSVDDIGEALQFR